jgi:hypothetical protein
MMEAQENIKPISPKEAYAQKAQEIPAFVVQAVNRLLTLEL